MKFDKDLVVEIEEFIWSKFPNRPFILLIGPSEGGQLGGMLTNMQPEDMSEVLKHYAKIKFTGASNN